MTRKVTVLDYGSGNLRSAQRALERVGAEVEVTADPGAAANADGLVVPGVGAFEACMTGLRAIGGEKIIADRVSHGRPVLGVCVGAALAVTFANYEVMTAPLLFTAFFLATSTAIRPLARCPRPAPG